MSAPWQPLLDWWFGFAQTPAEIVADKGRLWFGKRDSQDLEARERFGAQVEQALTGGLAEWTQCPEGWLAVVILLDQLPRMIFRDTPRAFCGDARAQALVSQGLAADFDRRLPAIQRVFIYLVLEHCESPAAQDEAVSRFVALVEEQAAEQQAVFADNLDYAERHRRVIARFGRFPHRNAILGRESTVEEAAFLREPGSGF
ncbi:DUF924 family protein [Pseudomonas agarici]|uniref:DUF924 family protein n=2 Tax=Pseudomonas agarici TaxID=46677 RepID=UPI0008C7394E|nr:DUF924 family protein [Pseudomonas agarici]NWB92479.1 DUF924 domain-containing protein [Pseudomonas agarici]NWC10707.1 DUF924 domain-containing protein [Pseudomonas agarici]SEL50417.1 Uncharacterized conserved protein, DUF924 family [Pseudomonas agarici]